MQYKLHVERGASLRLAWVASSHHTARCKVHKKQLIIKSPPPTMTIVFYSCNRSTYRHDSDTTVGVRSMENKKILPHRNKQAKIYLLDCSNESIENSPSKIPKCLTRADSRG